MTDNDFKRQASAIMRVVRPFLSKGQMAAMTKCARGEERAFFLKAFIDVSEQITRMPKTYEQDGKGDQAVAYLHYFFRGSDWYITEKDMEDGVTQAYGYAVINGDDDMAECGYINIAEIVSVGAELDLFFTPQTLAEIKAKREEAAEAAIWARPGP